MYQWLLNVYKCIDWTVKDDCFWSVMSFFLITQMFLQFNSQNNWIPRKEEKGPKKIQDVHKDFVQEQARAQYLQSQPLPPRNDMNQQPGSRRGSRRKSYMLMDLLNYL